MLLTDAALARIITGYEKKLKEQAATIEKLKRGHAAEKKSADAICAVKVIKEQAKYQACTLDRERQREIYRKALDSKKCPHPAWNYVSFIAGNIVAGGICAAIDRTR